ncbi:MAG: diphosphomevalonate decarboxylase [Gammaproteobacteria bacterium]|nr:diphosphomevalonate decarboxylase [Gammaproteobacteria bacterium]
MQKIAVVKKILQKVNHGSFVNSSGGKAFAPSNVALCKYWGKRDQELNLPVTSSLSISLGAKGATTYIIEQGTHDIYVLNGKVIATDSSFAMRLKGYLDLFRPTPVTNYIIEISATVPIAAGFASSACGFAALILALDDLYAWKLSKQELSILARLGSGSACRSLWDGFVEWQCGVDASGFDSYAKPLHYYWPDLRIGALVVSNSAKKISSRDAMQLTLATASSYADWPKVVENDLAQIKTAIYTQDFKLLAKTSEANAQKMHEMMAQTNPPINYSIPETQKAKDKIFALRKKDISVYFTQDAGPNLQLLFLQQDQEKIISAFPNLELIEPFHITKTENLILVDEHDTEIGIDEKMRTHFLAELHRAFSIFILRDRHGKIEVLLQKRAAGKYHSANLWTNTCCGHPRPNEEVAIAAKRRLNEEMGIVCDLKEVGKFHYKALLPETNLTENEIDHVFIGKFPEKEFSVNPDEVQDFAWVEIGELVKNFQAAPSKYTVWFYPALEFVLKQLEVN